MLLAKFLPKNDSPLGMSIGSEVSLSQEIRVPDLENELMKLGFIILNNKVGDTILLINSINGESIKFRPEHIEAVTLVKKEEQIYTALTLIENSAGVFFKLDKKFALPLAKLWVKTADISLNFDLWVYEDEDFKELIIEVYGSNFLSEIKEIESELKEEVRTQRYEKAAFLRDKGNELVHGPENEERFKIFLIKLKGKLSLEFWDKYTSVE